MWFFNHWFYFSYFCKLSLLIAPEVEFGSHCLLLSQLLALSEGDLPCIVLKGTARVKERAETIGKHISGHWKDVLYNKNNSDNGGKPYFHTYLPFLMTSLLSYLMRQWVLQHWKYFKRTWNELSNMLRENLYMFD